MIGKRLQLLRKRKKLTQDQVAKEVGLVRSTYSNYEAGKREPDFETLQKLAQFFGESISEILGEDKSAGGQALANNDELYYRATQVKNKTGIDITNDPVIMEELESYMLYLAQKSK